MDNNIVEFPEPSEFFSCPVCLELPQGEVQVITCTNGHIICGRCRSKLKHCPECRIKYGPKKIRIRSVEKYLNGMKARCPHAAAGCTEVVSRQNYQNHLKSCPFNGQGVQLCKLLGYNCNFLVNSADPNYPNLAVKHLQAEHQATMESVEHSKFLILNIQDLDEVEQNRQTPSIIEICDNSVVIVNSSYTEDGLWFSALHLKNNDEEDEDVDEDELIYAVEITIDDGYNPEGPLERLCVAKELSTLGNMPGTQSPTVTFPVQQLKKNSAIWEHGPKLVEVKICLCQFDE